MTTTTFCGIKLPENLKLDDTARRSIAKMFLSDQTRVKDIKLLFDHIAMRSGDIDFCQVVSEFLAREFISPDFLDIDKRLKRKVDKREDISDYILNRHNAWTEVFDDLSDDDFHFIAELLDINEDRLVSPPSEEELLEYMASIGFERDDDDDDNDDDDAMDNLPDKRREQIRVNELDQMPITVRCAKDLANLAKQYIKGQDRAIEQLAVPFFQHLDSAAKGYTCNIKSSVLMMGPTGVGKSELLRIMGKMCDCPVIFINTSEVRPSGWRGIHISDMIARELNNGVSIDRLKYAVIVLDEADKITKYGCHIVADNHLDEAYDMMRDIMKLLDVGHTLHLENGMNMSTGAPNIVELPVDNLLIVFNGAFQGIDDIIKRRLNISRSIGYGQSAATEVANVMDRVTADDLKQWGYIPELIGRIGEIVVLNPLTSETILEIMKSAKGNIVNSHVDYALRSNVELQFTDDALRVIAEEAYRSGLGFRNVKSLLSKTLNPLYYEMTDERDEESPRCVSIDRDYVLSRLKMRG